MRGRFASCVLAVLFILASACASFGETVLETSTSRVVFRDAELRPGAVALDVKVCNQRTWSARPERTQAPVVVATPEKYPVAIEFALKDADITSAVVRPLSEDVETSISDGVAKLIVKRPADLSVEFNGGVDRTAHLFLGSAADEDSYAAQAAGTPEDKLVRFEAGVHDVGRFKLQDGQTLYLAPGAILRGGVVCHGGAKVRIIGRGIITGEGCDRWDDQIVGLNLENCRDATVEGVSILDAAAWSMQLYKCRDVSVRKIRIVGSCSNSDGISVQSCRNVRCEDVFVRSWDDSLVVKAYEGDVEGITFERATLWTDLAQSMEIGFETRGDEMSKIAFRNVRVLHNFHKPVISIHNSDSAKVHDVLFENIVVEDAQMGLGDGVPLLIDFAVLKSQWSKRELTGTVRDVVVRNVQVLAGREDIGLRFLSETPGGVDGIAIEGLTVFGERVDSGDKIRIERSPNCGAGITLEGRPL